MPTPSRGKGMSKCSRQRRLGCNASGCSNFRYSSRLAPRRASRSVKPCVSAASLTFPVSNPIPIWLPCSRAPPKKRQASKSRALARMHPLREELGRVQIWAWLVHDFGSVEQLERAPVGHGIEHIHTAAHVHAADVYLGNGGRTAVLLQCSSDARAELPLLKRH